MGEVSKRGNPRDDIDEHGVIQSGRFAGSHTRPPSVHGGQREIWWHRPVPATVESEASGPLREGTRESHPAWGLVSASRVTSTPGAVLFDSDIRHQHYIRLTVKRATRDRDLKRDWIHDTGPELIEINMSEAQWAAMTSSMNTSGVPCTIRSTETQANVDGLLYEPRLRVSMDEVRGEAERIQKRLDAAVKAVAEKPTKANIRALEHAMEGVRSNMEFAAKSLEEHAENVVQKARNDIESMVTQKAVQLGVDPQSLAFTLEGESPVQAIEAAPTTAVGEDGQTYTFEDDA
jgi:hypothetical protein